MLRDGLWPVIKIIQSFEDQFTKIGDIYEEFDEVEHFVRQL